MTRSTKCKECPISLCVVALSIYSEVCPCRECLVNTMCNEECEKRSELFYLSMGIGKEMDSEFNLNQESNNENYQEEKT